MLLLLLLLLLLCLRLRLRFVLLRRCRAVAAVADDEHLDLRRVPQRRARGHPRVRVCVRLLSQEHHAAQVRAEPQIREVVSNSNGAHKNTGQEKHSTSRIRVWSGSAGRTAVRMQHCCCFPYGMYLRTTMGCGTGSTPTRVVCEIRVRRADSSTAFLRTKHGERMTKEKKG